ncbi:MAG: YggS family pyridoxal phosphate-dependent enzyme [bacterium]|nr:YggS family pyridoxal phosphate-dependent enzyme [bacterium]
MTHITKDFIADNLKRVREHIETACARVGRNPESVTLVAVTKTHGADVVSAAIEAGVTDVGENRIHEFLDKKDAVTLRCRWHLIGTLQRNKAGRAIDQFSLIHSVDRLKLAETLSRLGGERNVTSRILLEVNTSGEKSKHGFVPAEVYEAATKINGLPNLELRGLMTIGPFTDEMTRVRRAFQSLFRLREKVSESSGIDMPHLSMGMTGDFQIAIEEGSTIIRVGRVLFGGRGPAGAARDP